MPLKTRSRRPFVGLRINTIPTRGQEMKRNSKRSTRRIRSYQTRKDASVMIATDRHITVRVQQAEILSGDRAEVLTLMDFHLRDSIFPVAVLKISFLTFSAGKVRTGREEAGALI